MNFTSAMRLTITLYVLFALVTVGIVSYAAGASNTRAEQPLYSVTVEEDGSGTQTIGDQEVKTFDADTFVWDCSLMGNKVCG